MGREGLIGAHLVVTEVVRAQLDPLAGGVWRQQRLELFCHANLWTITLDAQLPPAVASVPAELCFPQLKMPFNSPAPKRRSLHGAFCGYLGVSPTAAAHDPVGGCCPLPPYLCRLLGRVLSAGAPGPAVGLVLW